MRSTESLASNWLRRRRPVNMAGRLIEAMGDGFLVKFASAVEAVTAAQSIQQSSLRLPLRIDVGYVVAQGDDPVGDGVNIASRIEGLADAGGIAISRQVHLRDQCLACDSIAAINRKPITC